MNHMIWINIFFKLKKTFLDNQKGQKQFLVDQNPSQAIPFFYEALQELQVIRFHDFDQSLFYLNIILLVWVMINELMNFSCSSFFPVRRGISTKTDWRRSQTLKAISQRREKFSTGIATVTVTFIVRKCLG